MNVFLRDGKKCIPSNVAVFITKRKWNLFLLSFCVIHTVSEPVRRSSGTSLRYWNWTLPLALFLTTVFKLRYEGALFLRRPCLLKTNAAFMQLPSHRCIVESIQYTLYSYSGFHLRDYYSLGSTIKDGFSSYSTEQHKYFTVRKRARRPFL